MTYTVTDSQSSLVIASCAYAETARRVALAAGLSAQDVIVLDPAKPNTDPSIPKLLPECSDETKEALIIYTSGTTGRPKGVVTTHKTIRAQCESLIQAWRYTEQDRLLHVLPLHHIHGIVNAMTAPLFSGGVVEFMPKFDASRVWQRLLDTHEEGRSPITMFMAVPTVYSRLIDHAKSSYTTKEAQATAREACSQMRLMVSGSAALPSPIKYRWLDISGHTLLERYGMTEIGMALSCSYDDVSKRFDASVGWPLPGVAVRLVSEEGDVTECQEKEGEIQVKGDTVFTTYFNRPDSVTRKEFTDDGWFRTGDIAIRKFGEYDGAYFIQGRASVDIIKSGGFKISVRRLRR